MTAFIKVNGAKDFERIFSVSRETLGQLEAYLALLRTWQQTTNLVGAKSLEYIWQRHVADSAQLIALAPRAVSWIDLGSGAGFPGMVIAILCANRQDFRMRLIESNAKKSAFLSEAARITGAPVEIVEQRIESVLPSAIVPPPDIVTARALAPLPALLGLAAPYLAGGGHGLFPKGREARAEIDAARRRFEFGVTLHPSRTDPQASILDIAGPVISAKETR